MAEDKRILITLKQPSKGFLLHTCTQFTPAVQNPTNHKINSYSYETVTLQEHLT